MISEERIKELADMAYAAGGSRPLSDMYRAVAIAAKEATEAQIRRDASLCKTASFGHGAGYLLACCECEKQILVQLSPATPKSESPGQEEA